MIFIAAAIAVLIVSVRLGGFSHWFSNFSTHSAAASGTQEVRFLKQESGKQGNVGEKKQINLQPEYVSFSGSLSASVQEVEPTASGIESTSKTKDLVAQYEEKLVKDANNGKLHFYLATTLLKAGREPDAIFHYSEAIRLDGSNHIALNNMAWIRASHPDPRFRNGIEAVRLAKQACELTGYKQSDCLDTLAIAYAEAEQFTEAISTAEKALELAKSANQKAVVDEIQGHLALFRAGKPYRDSARPAAPPVSDR